MKSIRRQLALFFSKEKGDVLVLVAVSMVALLAVVALVVDVGALYVARRQMVNAADAAALAAVQELISNPGNVQNVAEQYAYDLNGSEQLIVSTTANTVTVTTGKTVAFTFARAIGFVSENVPATATAMVGPISTAGGLIPIGVPLSVYNSAAAGAIDVIKFQMDFGPGNWGWISFEGTGNQFNPNTIANHIRDGYPNPVSIGDSIQTRTGTLNPKMKSEINKHIANGTELYVPIVEDGSGAGTSSFVIVGFAKIVLEDQWGIPAHTTIQARVEEGLFEGAIDPNAPDFGLRGITLID